jgi:hypothetical protein
VVDQRAYWEESDNDRDFSAQWDDGAGVP